MLLHSCVTLKCVYIVRVPIRKSGSLSKSGFVLSAMVGPNRQAHRTYLQAGYTYQRLIPTTTKKGLIIHIKTTGNENMHKTTHGATTSSFWHTLWYLYLRSKNEDLNLKIAVFRLKRIRQDDFWFSIYIYTFIHVHCIYICSNQMTQT